MALLEPLLCVLDETDSGLDIDALKVVANGVNQMRSSERGMVVITHYQRLLNHIVPDVVHVLSAGRIVKSGGKELALELEASGYAQFQGEAAAARFDTLGLPNRRVEEWKYTDLRALIGEAKPLAGLPDAAAKARGKE